MTYTVKVRGAPGHVMAEYECPEHGRFERLLRDPPDEIPCPCPLEWDPEGFTTVECGKPAHWTISAPKPKTLSVLPTALVKGGDTDRRPGMLDTRPLAEGQSYSEWRKVQDKGREERRHQMLVSKGLKAKRIQVG